MVDVFHIGMRIEGMTERCTHLIVAVRRHVGWRYLLDVRVVVAVRMFRLITGRAGPRVVSLMRMIHGGRPPSFGCNRAVARTAVIWAAIPNRGIANSMIPP
jgi:hypothetical protein